MARGKFGKETVLFPYTYTPTRTQTIMKGENSPPQGEGERRDTNEGQESDREQEEGVRVYVLCVPPSVCAHAPPGGSSRGREGRERCARACPV